MIFLSNITGHNHSKTRPFKNASNLNHRYRDVDTSNVWLHKATRIIRIHVLFVYVIYIYICIYIMIHVLYIDNIHKHKYNNM